MSKCANEKFNEGLTCKERYPTELVEKRDIHSFCGYCQRNSLVVENIVSTKDYIHERITPSPLSMLDRVMELMTE